MTHDKTVIQFSFVVLVNKVKRFSMSIIHEKTPTVMAGVFLFSYIDRTVSHTSRNIFLKKYSLF